jgi:hypothetical protein
VARLTVCGLNGSVYVELSRLGPRADRGAITSYSVLPMFVSLCTFAANIHSKIVSLEQ